MWSFFNVSSLKRFIKKAFTFIITIILLVGYGSGFSLCINLIIKNKVGGKEPFLISLSSFNTVILMIIPIVILLLIFIYFKFKEYSKGSKLIPVYSGLTYLGQMRKKKASKIYNITFVVLIAANAFLFLYLVNDYTLAYKNKIEKHNLISTKNISYNYNDIKDVSIGAKWRKNGGDFYYIVNFKDNSKINLSSNTISEKSTLDSLLELDEIIKKNNIQRRIDKKNFHNLVQNLGEEYVKKYEELFR